MHSLLIKLGDRMCIWALHFNQQGRIASMLYNLGCWLHSLTHRKIFTLTELHEMYKSGNIRIPLDGITPYYVSESFKKMDKVWWIENHQLVTLLESMSVIKPKTNGKSKSNRKKGNGE